MSKVGNILKSLRVKESLTQEELAKILKMPRSTIGMYEQGKRVPPTEVLEEFADFYNVEWNKETIPVITLGRRRGALPCKRQT